MRQSLVSVAYPPHEQFDDAAWLSVALFVIPRAQITISTVVFLYEPADPERFNPITQCRCRCYVGFRQRRYG